MNKILYFSFLFISFLGTAQKNVTETNLQWFQYTNALKLSEKYTLFSDINLRKTNNFSDWSQITFRSGLGYPIIDNLAGISGIAYFTFLRQDKFIRTEYRLYQDLNSIQEIGKFFISHRLRMEARYFNNLDENQFATPNNFNFRFRYRLSCLIPIYKIPNSINNQEFLLNLSNEIFVNFGKQIVYNMFDNNRFLVGATFRQNKNLSYTLSYMNQFGQRGQAGSYENSNILNIIIAHRISLKKSKGQIPLQPKEVEEINQGDFN
jgi:hypothetical protein